MYKSQVVVVLVHILVRIKLEDFIKLIFLKITYK